MNPVIDFISAKDDILQFTLSGVNVSIANSLRRTVLSDIPLVVFKTSPYEENRANILVNTSRLNNEILKQRLSCIPIHINNLKEFPLKNYQLEINVENNTDTLMFVTTKDFIIKDLLTNKPIDPAQNKEIFPPFQSPNGDFYIDFVRLRPKISDTIPGEKIQLTCTFSVSTAKDDGMFNAVSTCAYGYTQDKDKKEAELAKKLQSWKDEKKEEIEFEIKNWELLEALRIVKQDSFDFTIKTVGIYTNDELLKNACSILIEKITHFVDLMNSDKLKIEKSNTTMSNCYDVTLENEDYTIGKALEFILYTKFYEEAKTLSFCGFSKSHPHNDYSTIRLAYFNPTEISNIKKDLMDAFTILHDIYTKIKKEISTKLKGK